MPPWMAARVALKAGWLALVAAIALAIAGFGMVQTIRLEGLHIWPLSIEGWRPLAQERGRQLAAIKQAQIDAGIAAQAAKAAQETTYREISERIDEHAENEIDRALRDADRFIAAGGMRREAAGSQPCPAPAAGPDHRAANSAAAGPATQLDGTSDSAGAGLADPARAGAEADLVTVRAADIRICTINTLKAEAGRAFAQQLQQASAPSENEN